MAAKLPPKLEPIPVDGPFCRNCGARADVNFCPVCGQETRIEMPTVGHFVAEFAEQTLALQGQLWRTLYSLLFKPGQLTLDYVAGRRQRYVRPLRLYLAISISFFAILGLTAGEHLFNFDDKAADSAVGELKKEIRAERDAARRDGTASGTPSPVDEAALDAKIDGAVERAVAASQAEAKADKNAQTTGPAGPAGADTAKRGDKPSDNEDFNVHTGNAAFDARLKDRVDRFRKLPREEMALRATNAFLNYAPFAMFLLLPLFALFLKVGYLRRDANYAIHLLFAVNYHSFIFVLLLIGQLSMIGDYSGLLAVLVGGYLLLALRRVHGGGWLSTALFVFLLSLVYVAALSVTLVLSTVLPLALL